jgi:hypothetical protein
MPKPSAYSRFSEKTKKKIRKRQETNGFSDIDGLRNEIHELEPDYQISRTTTGRISKSMKDDATRAKHAADIAEAFLKEVGDKIHDTAAFNNLILDARFNEMIGWLEITKEDIEQLDPVARMNLLFKITNAQSSNAKAQRFVAPERRTIKQETAALKDGQTNNEAKQRLAEKLAAILEKSKT